MDPVRRSSKTRGGSARWMRVVLTGVGVLVVGLVVFFVGGRWWLDRVLHGDDFRRFLDEKTSAALHGQARIAPLRWEGSEVYSPEITVRGSANGPLTNFDVDAVRAVFDFSALWKRVWRVDSISVEQIKAEVAATNLDKDAPPPRRLEEVAPPDANGSLLARLLPNRMDIGEVRIADFSLRWDHERTATAGRVERVRVDARMLGDVHQWEVEGHGGILVQSGLPDMRLDGFSLKTTEDAIYLTRAMGRPVAGGTVEISGNQAVHGDRAMALVIDVDQVSLEPFLPVDWRGRLHGRAHGQVHLTGSPDAPKSWHSTGQMEIRDGVVEALPVLDQLAVFADSARYRHAPVQRGAADFDWTPERLQVHNLTVESEGLLRVEGDFTVRDRQIDGYFRVGVAITSVHWVNDLGAAVFDLPRHDGYAWTTMHLTGPVDHPHEDLSGRMAVSAEQALIRKAKQGSETLLDTASGLLDLLKPH